MERLSDIVHADAEPDVDGFLQLDQPLAGEIEVRNLGFRYSPQDPWILRGINLKVKAGERVAFVGPSGGGKSTLLKLLTGLYTPEEGEILIDGKPLKAIGARAYRQQIGVIMQDDQLLSGTIGDNVAFFDSQIDMKKVESVCVMAQIHNDIMRLPMGYHSLIGDMGSTLSGGQRQRVLLARALYREPRLLFMDEGTANLDAALEHEVLGELKNLSISQIVVAHRTAAVEFAEAVYVVSGSTVKQKLD